MAAGQADGGIIGSDNSSFPLLGGRTAYGASLLLAGICGDFSSSPRSGGK